MVLKWQTKAIPRLSVNHVEGERKKKLQTLQALRRTKLLKFIAKIFKFTLDGMASICLSEHLEVPSEIRDV